MRTETEAGPTNGGTNLINSVPRSLEEMPSRPPHPLGQRRILWIGILGWTAFAGFAFWWLMKGNGGLWVWVFQEGDLDQPGFSEKIQALFRGDLGLQRAYPWVLFGPYLALMAWYFPLERERLRRNVVLNVAACIAFVWACRAIDLRTTGANLVMVNPDYRPAPGAALSEANRFGPSRGRRTPRRFPGGDRRIQFGRLPAPGQFNHPPPPPRSGNVSLRFTILDLLAYGAITGLVHSVNFHRRMRERERRALFLESNLANARLNTLQAQLQPHFLFNSLNAIAALLRRDPRLAETTLVSLSELLRLALSQSDRQELALRDELEFVQRYVEIQQTRFGDKLRVEQEIEPQALDCMVPTLVLQPLVENAIRHGIEPGEKAGVVRVSASRNDGKLVLAVEDDGIGPASDSAGPENPLCPGSPPPGLRAEPRPSGSVVADAARSSPPPAGSLLLTKTGTGIGLANLRERLQALYGARQKLEFKRRTGGGVIVRIEIPWHPVRS